MTTAISAASCVDVVMQVQWTGNRADNTNWGEPKSKHCTTWGTLPDGDIIASTPCGRKQVGRASGSVVDGTVLPAKRTSGNGGSGAVGRRIDSAKLRNIVALRQCLIFGKQAEAQHQGDAHSGFPTLCKRYIKFHKLKEID